MIKAVIALIVILGVVIFTPWRTVYSLSSPDGRYTLTVQERCLVPDCQVRVYAKEGWWPAKKIASKSDCMLHFAQAVWSESVVAVFLDGGICGSIKAAYDLRLSRAVDFHSAEAALKQTIVKEYAITPEELQETHGDVFSWATYDGSGQMRRANAEFMTRSSRPW